MTDSVDVAAFTGFERRGWDRAAQGYHHFFGPITAAVADLLVDAVPVRAGSRLLDVATGPGYIAARAVRRGAATVGVDLSEGIAALARQLNPHMAVGVASALALPFHDAAFDVCTAGFLLPHLADHDRALAEARRVLAPGGVIALSTWGPPGEVPLLDAVVRAASEAGAAPPDELPTGPPFFAYSDPDALDALLGRAGFRDVVVTRHELIHRVASAEALLQGVLAGSVRTSTLLAAQPDHVQRGIRAALARLVEPYERDDGLELPVSALVARGSRPG